MTLHSLIPYSGNLGGKVRLFSLGLETQERTRGRTLQTIAIRRNPFTSWPSAERIWPPMARAVLGNQKQLGSTAAAAPPTMASRFRVGRSAWPILPTKLPRPYAMFRTWLRKQIQTIISATKDPVQETMAAPASPRRAGAGFLRSSINKQS